MTTFIFKILDSLYKESIELEIKKNSLILILSNGELYLTCSKSGVFFVLEKSKFFNFTASTANWLFHFLSNPD